MEEIEKVLSLINKIKEVSNGHKNANIFAAINIFCADVLKQSISEDSDSNKIREVYNKSIKSFSDCIELAMEYYIKERETNH